MKQSEQMKGQTAMTNQQKNKTAVTLDSIVELFRDARLHPCNSHLYGYDLVIRKLSGSIARIRFQMDSYQWGWKQLLDELDELSNQLAFSANYAEHEEKERVSDRAKNQQICAMASVLVRDIVKSARSCEIFSVNGAHYYRKAWRSDVPQPEINLWEEQ